MSPLAVLLSSLGLLLVAPAAVPEEAPVEPASEVTAKSVAESTMADVLDQAEQQVRIEQQTTIIRIAPRTTRRPMSELYDSGQPTFRERKMSRCVPIGAISGVQITPDSRLLLFMRDQRLVSATLDRACNPEDFYSGFYIERSKDGLMCTGRDELHSRTGAHCPVARLRELVP